MRLGPGATIGILGGGQLARMIGYEALRMGYELAVLDPHPACPAAPVSRTLVEAPWDDRDGALEVAEVADVVTLDTEHIPWTVLTEVEEMVALNPSSSVLRTIQDRDNQKRFLEENDFPTARFANVTTDEELAEALETVGAPSLFKTRRGGYDGKGQARVRQASEAEAAWERIDRQPAILEAWVPYEREVSVVLARDVNGNTAPYPVVENVHVDGVLHTSRAPARIPPEVAREATELASNVAEALDHVGTIAVEMFLLPEDHDQRLLVNEIAPRVHNSGHWTEAATTTQFEQHLRAICGLELADPTLPRPAAMVNLLGDLWAKSEPDWNVVLDEPHAALNLYGKAEARPGRKMGHVTVTHDDGDEALRIAERIHATLAKRAAP